MTDANTPQEVEIEQANAKLSEGLKSCRSVVENYRSMLGAGEAANDGDAPAAANDDVSITDGQRDGSL